MAIITLENFSVENLTEKLQKLFDFVKSLVSGKETCNEMIYSLIMAVFRIEVIL